ncbi:MAG: division/cell wall cluster transcriptional repressor MraZ [Chloroflexi bacterium]|nr:division/cell wall cluster transcriptional repressor MraZ [Chloroflexota bacterium]
MFLGQYEHSIDSKGRLTIPARFRDLLIDGAYITLGFDNSLMVMTSDYFNRMVQKINAMNMADPTSRQFRRFIFSKADHQEIDRAGRILIQQFLRDAVGLQDNVIVVGVGEYVEIWTPEAWNRQNEALQNAEETAERFASLDLTVSRP